MAIDFSHVDSVAIAEGNVKKIEQGGVVLWQKPEPGPTPTGTYVKVVDNGDDTSTVYLRGTHAAGYSEYNVNSSYEAYIAGSFANNGKITSIIVESECKLPSNCKNMFSNCTQLTLLDVSYFDTSNVTNMSSMFAWCSSLTSLNLSTFDTSNVYAMYDMFICCSSLTSLDLSNFDTSNVIDMPSMFMNCSSLQSLNLSNFDTSKVTNMNWMFYGCSSLTSLDLSSFNTTNVTGMYSMFNNCNLASLDLSNFNTSNVTNMISMFNSCSQLQHIYVSDLWNTDKVTSSLDMFSGDTNLHNYNSEYTDKTKAIIDDGSNGGYLERKS